MKESQYRYRHTKIIFTIGPATMSVDVLVELLRKGVDVCRLNMAHASHEWTAQAIANVREAGRLVGRKVALLMDIKGPEIRTGALDEPFELVRDQVFDFYTDASVPPGTGEIKGVSINYPSLISDVSEGDTILVDSGLLRMRVEKIMEDRIRCSVRIGGPLGSRRHINLPGVHVNLPALTAKDQADLVVGIEHGVDFFALSFVRSADDLDILRRTLTDKGSRAHIIAKIEDQSALTNLSEIITASDGLMVARGDLGIEIPYETLPLVQRKAVRTCQSMGKPVIIATHMLESMIQNPLPTRAEISDIANAVHEQADCVMLSGETTVGKYPVECVEVMNRIITSIESQTERRLNDTLKLRTPKDLLLKSAIYLSDEIKDCAVTVFTRSGYLARTLSAMRSRNSPIYAFTDRQAVFQNLLMYWGVEPFQIVFEEDPERTVLNAFELLRSKGWVESGDNSVVISNVLAGRQVIETIQYRIIP
jgi:pyruvate kinase